MGYLQARTPRGEAETADAAGRGAGPGESLRYDALRFPGCVRISLTLEAFENSDDRIEYWDAGTETAWVVADNYAVHEGTSRRLPHLAERIASVRGTPIASYGSVTLLVRDADGRPRRAMEADETQYLHPTRATIPEKSLIIGEHDFPDVVLEVDHTTDVRPGKLLLYEAWGFPELVGDRAPGRGFSKATGGSDDSPPAGRTVPARADERRVYGMDGGRDLRRDDSEDAGRIG